MPAMHEDVLAAMEKELESKFALMKRLIPFQMTHEECITLVAPREHIPILTQAAKYANISASEAWFAVQVPAYVDGESGTSVQFLMRTHGQKQPPLRPRSPFWQYGLGDGEAAAGERVIAWLDARLKLGRRFGTVKATLRHLNKACENGAQLRYLMPSVMHLCKRHSNFTDKQNARVDAWGMKFSAYKPVRHHPVVSPQLKGYIQDASALLTSAMLIGDDIPEPDMAEVVIAECGLPNFWWGPEDVGFNQPRM